MQEGIRLSHDCGLRIIDCKTDSESVPHWVVAGFDLKIFVAKCAIKFP